jgi:hypothetical protein
LNDGSVLSLGQTTTGRSERDIERRQERRSAEEGGRSIVVLVWLLLLLFGFLPILSRHTQAC